MSIVISTCITCENSNWSVEDLLRMAFDCDGTGKAYLRTYNPFSSTQFCGDFASYTASTRTVDGESHVGLLVTHSLNKLTALFLTVWNEEGIQVTVTAEVVDANTLFIITDGLETEDGRFCIM